jgi:hypothetical protein
MPSQKRLKSNNFMMPLLGQALSLLPGVPLDHRVLMFWDKETDIVLESLMSVLLELSLLHEQLLFIIFSSYTGRKNNLQNVTCLGFVTGKWVTALISVGEGEKAQEPLHHKPAGF